MTLGILRPPPPPAPKPAPVPQAAPPVVQPAPVQAEVEEAEEVPSAEEKDEVTAPDEEINQEDVDLAPQQLDQPEVVETEAEVFEPVQSQEPEPAQTQEDPLHEPEVAAAEPMKDPWSSVQAPVSAWEQTTQETQESSAPAVPESTKPVAQTDSYAGPPGFNPAVKAAMAPVRTNSRAALRYKADGQAVMLPNAGSSGLDMQFGNLNFGNADADEAE
jgi:hypothetical protein